MAPDSNGSDLLNGILPKQPERAVAPPPKRFKPWHKPRKQYVRKFQWLDEIRDLIPLIHFPEDSKVFRYLSLPGNDLLDVRYIRTVCEQSGLVLKYTGLNSVTPGSPDEIELNLAANDLSGFDSIHNQSTIVIERFEAIAEQRSLAYGHVRQAVPYHCINIDLCNSVAARRQTRARASYIDAIGELVRLQTKFAAHAWLLFLTTRVGADVVDTGNLTALVNAIQVNVAHSRAFKESLQQLIQVRGEELSQKLRAAKTLTANQFKNIFCVGFGKWLLTFLQTAHPQMDFIKLRSYYYSVRSGQPDMVSLAYRCQPRIIAPTDRFGLVQDSVQQGHLSESAMAMSFLEATQSMLNVDELLAKDQDLMDTMIVETETLLRGAGYLVDDEENGYRAWLERGAPHA